MTIIDQHIVADRLITVYETSFGMLMREEGYIGRIKDGECSYGLMVEICESTLPYINVKNLMENLINLNEWATETLALRCMMQAVIAGCEERIPTGAIPATGGALKGGDATGFGFKEYPRSYR